MPDKRALEDFLECETDENIRSLRSELQGVSQGNHPPDMLNNLIGKSRENRHGSYEQWAVLMMQWIAGYRKY
jgi:hypothetical protein